MSKITKTIAALGVVAGLGVAALPLASYAADTDTSKDLTVSAQIGETLSVTLNHNSVTLKPTNGGAVVDTTQETAQTVVATVTTNNLHGYTLKLADADTEYALTNEDGQKIAAGTPAQDQSLWGVKFNDADAYTALGAAGFSRNEADATADDGETTNIDFAVSASPSQASGTYTNTMTVTVTANEA